MIKKEWKLEANEEKNKLTASALLSSVIDCIFTVGKEKSLAARRGTTHITRDCVRRRKGGSTNVFGILMWTT